MIQQILAQTHWQNRFMPEDDGALTRLFSSHINPYSLFPLDFSKRIQSVQIYNYVRNIHTG